MPIITYREALTQALREEMQRDDRVMLMGAVERRDVIDGALVDAVVADMARDAFSVASASAQDSATTQSFATDSVALDLAARVAMLESHAEEQGAVLRRTLSLLVQWAESEVPVPRSEFFRAPAA